LADPPPPPPDPTPISLERARLQLEHTRYRTEFLKWIVIAVGAVVSFMVIDYGKLKLEQFRVTSENQRALLNSYLTATESPQPDVWKRKLHILLNFADDQRIKDWAEAELRYIESFAALDALYRETLKVAAQLVDRGRLNEPERLQARSRFEQLYWGDLPYAGESQQVVSAMIGFRNALIAAESAGPEGARAWQELSTKLIQLSQALRDSTPKYPAPSTVSGDR
jgi:hypothetical protein